jgi:lipopolysaccharide export system permease protein
VIVKIGKKDAKGENLSDIIIYDHSKDIGNVSVTVAKQGKMYSEDNGNTLVFQLYDGFTNEEDIAGENADKRPFVRMQFKEQLVRLDVSNFAFQEADKNRYQGHYKTMNLAELITQINVLQHQQQDFYQLCQKSITKQSLLKPSKASSKGSIYSLDEYYNKLSLSQQQLVQQYIKGSIATIRNEMAISQSKYNDDSNSIILHQLEAHRKLTLPAACLILFFIGAPLGALIRKGGLGMPVVLSIVAFLMYYLVGMTGEKLAREGTINPILGMWLSSLVFLSLGVFLAKKATNDSSLLNTEFWQAKLGTIIEKTRNLFRK